MLTKLIRPIAIKPLEYFICIIFFKSLTFIQNINNDFINNKFDLPVIVYCNTIKGKGISTMENNNSYHHIKNLSESDYIKIINEIESSK